MGLLPKLQNKWLNMPKINRRIINVQNVVCQILLVLTVLILCQQVAMCSPLTNLMQSAKGFVGTLYSMAKVVLPLGMAISGLCMIFTRDERKLAQEKTILIGCIVGFIICWMAKNSGDIITFFENIASGSYTEESVN